GTKELPAMKDEDKGVEITCLFCNQTYYFTEEDLEKIINDSIK
ncbi:Hsp33 family molecular chaperone HslO, partial [Streptococcus agalactiae]